MVGRVPAYHRRAISRRGDGVDEIRGEDPDRGSLELALAGWRIVRRVPKDRAQALAAAQDLVDVEQQRAEQRSQVLRRWLGTAPESFVRAEADDSPLGGHDRADALRSAVAAVAEVGDPLQGLAFPGSAQNRMADDWALFAAHETLLLISAGVPRSPASGVVRSGIPSRVEGPSDPAWLNKPPTDVRRFVQTSDSLRLVVVIQVAMQQAAEAPSAAVLRRIWTFLKRVHASEVLASANGMALLAEGTPWAQALGSGSPLVAAILGGDALEMGQELTAQVVGS